MADACAAGAAGPAGASAAAAAPHPAAAAAAGAGTARLAARAADLPSDALAIRGILKTAGVEAHEPRVVNMLLDFMYSYVSGVLSDAAAFAEQVGRPPGEVEGEDVALAIAVKTRHAFVPRPSLEVLRQVAEQVNERRLPDLDAKGGLGLRVPADEHLLIQPNWRINAAAAEDAAAAAAAAATNQQQSAAQQPPPPPPQQQQQQQQQQWPPT